MSDPVVILDRDGVINEDSEHYIKSLEEWRPIPGSIEAMARLCHGGYRIAIATNQSGLARGLFTPAHLDAMHQRLRELLAAQGARVELIAFCPHGPDEGCNCRKPRPGLLLSIAKRLDLDLTEVPVIGDSVRDLEAALAVGASPWLVRTGKGEQTLARLPEHPELGVQGAIPVFNDLNAAADVLLTARKVL